MTAQLLLTETEAADRLRLCPRTLRKARKAGTLPYVLIGRAIRYTLTDLESYIEALRRQATPCIAPAKPKRRPGRHKSAEISPFTARAATR
jgi:excisionase family DNA binding protein